MRSLPVHLPALAQNGSLQSAQTAWNTCGCADLTVEEGACLGVGHRDWPLASWGASSWISHGKTVTFATCPLEIASSTVECLKFGQVASQMQRLYLPCG